LQKNPDQIVFIMHIRSKMKRNILIKLLLFTALASYSQFNDTIFLNSGKVEPVYKINAIFKNNLYYTHQKGEEQKVHKLTNVQRISSVEKILQDDFFTAITKVGLISNDTIVFDSNILKKIHEIQIAPIQYNLDKFYKQKRISHYIMGAGVLSGIIFSTDPIENAAFGYIASGLGLISFLIDIDSYKWIKKASLETNGKRVTLKIEL
jgi:hypothetical protein